MNIKLQLPKLTNLRPRIVVVGVGGAGSNAVNNMISSGLTGVTFVVANTDAQSLANSTAEHRIQLGAALTEGLGAGARPEIGKAAAEEAIEEIRAQVSGAHMVFVAAGMGGGTGTGAAAVIARIAREAGALTVGVVTKPFQFEGTRRMRAAELGVAALRPEVDTLIVIPNQNLFRIANERTTFAEAFVLADQVLYSGIACVVDLIVKEGLINLDFADVRTVMSGMGTAMMGTGEASGQGRAVMAAEEAISNPLLDDISLRGARGLLVSITGNRDMTLYEVDEAANRVRQEVDAEATIIVGATYDDALGDRIRVSIVASGMERMGERIDGLAEPPLAQLSTRPQTAPVTVQAVPSEGYRASQDASAGRYPDQAGLTKAISEALGSGQLSAPASQVQPPPPPGWASQAGAVFAEAPPQLPPMAEYDRQGVNHPHPSVHTPVQDFEPQRPAEASRAGRRLPQVEDFPLVGQREYMAKSAQYADAPPPPRAYAHPPAEPPRKLGFFQRLFGARSKTASKQAESAIDPQVPARSEHQHSHWGAPPVPVPQTGLVGAPRQSGEHDDLPVIFGTGRR